MKLTVLNDWHIGAVRTAGTTPATAYQLRLDLLQQFEQTLAGIHTDLLLAGDLFDGPDISKQDLLQTFMILRNWLDNNSTCRLWAMNGNHDLSKSSQVLSSFQFLMALLVEHSNFVHHITEGQMTPHGYMIPHVANQDLFNLELAKVPECPFLFVHCNYDNGFAVDSDHSLNLSKWQAVDLPVTYIVFAHEHQARRELDGKVFVIGNQVPSSVSDCLHNEKKQHIVVEMQEHGPSILGQAHWHAADDFLEVDWRELKDLPAEVKQRFIRVTGTATAAEAGAVPTTIARFRRDAKALVITNAVKIEGVDDAAQMALSHEEITHFNVRAALQEYLGPVDWARIEALEKSEVEPEKEAA